MSEIPWNVLAESITTAISAVTAPDKLHDALNYPNPILHFIFVTAYQNGTFGGTSRVNSATLTNTGPQYVEPADNPGQCNLRLEFSNDYSIDIHPNQRVEIEPFKKSVLDLGLEGIFEGLRKGNIGSMIVTTPV